MGNKSDGKSPIVLRHLLAAGALAALPLLCAAQYTPGVRQPQSCGYMERARLMLSDRNYQGTIDQLRRMTVMDSSSAVSEETLYLLARACYGEGSSDTEKSASLFLSLFPASAHAGEIRRLSGDFYFFNGLYAKAMSEYARTDIEGLAPGLRNRYIYREGVCHVKTGMISEAKKEFSRLRDVADYSVPAEYYLSYIDYLKGDYDSALQGFLRTQGKSVTATGESDLYPDRIDPAPYIAQIYFYKGDFSRARSMAEEQLASGLDKEFIPEMQRIAGESSFRTGDITAARRYLSAYLSTPDTAFAPSALYDMGTILYDEGKYQEAAGLFGKVTDEGNEISQGAYLYLGQCAMQQGDDSEAAIDFERAYRLGYDRKVSETALYNYVAALTSGGRVPFGSSAGLMEDFLKTFPRSKYEESVRRYLASAYFNEKNYAKALSNIEAMSHPDKEAMQLKQKALYELGVEAASASKWKEAASYMSRCAALSQYDRNIAHQARLWESESLYGAGEFPAAAKSYEAFLKSAKKGPDRALGVYGLAYSLYMQDKFSSALPYFKEASGLTDLPAELRTDALVRSGDCAYYCGDYSSAARIFASAASSAGDKAYVLMRKAMMDGLLGDTQSKIKGLEEMTSAYPSSRWTSSALFELAATYSEQGKTSKAESIYLKITESYPDSPESRKGLLLLGSLYKRNSSPDKAAQAYKRIITRWPSSEEAIAANEELRSIYADKGDLNSYLSFIQSVPGAPQPDRLVIEKAAFEAAENPWLDDIRSTTRLKNFLRDYPGSRYVPAALLDLAIAEEDAGRYQASIDYLTQLLSSHRDSAQAPEAMSMKARILEENFPDRKSDILAAYTDLDKSGGAAFAPEAAAGLARLSENPADRLRYAEKALASRDLDEDLREELLYCKGEALGSLGRTDEAVKLLSSLAENPASLSGAKSTVALGELYLRGGQADKTVKLLSGFADEGTPHQYWLARGYITLADAYMKQGRRSTAIEYLKSLRDNYPGNEADIQQMIDSRLKTWK